MSEGEGPPQQKYCTNCGAEARPGIKFCVSCGASLTQEPLESSPANLQPPPRSDQPPVDALRESLERLRQRLAGVFTKIRGANLGDAPAKAINWFRDLPSVPKLILVGLVLLLVLTILSPLVVVVAALGLGVSIIGLIIRVAQRGSVRGWGITAVSFLVLVFVFGSVSNAMYGIGFGGGTGSGSDYEIVNEGAYPLVETSSDEEQGSFRLVMVASDSLDEEQLQTIAQDMIPHTADYDGAIIMVFDRDEAYYGDGVQSVGTEEPYSGDVYNIWITHTPIGESYVADHVPARVGEYAIERAPGPGNSDVETYNDVQYYDYEEADTGTNDRGADDVGTSAEDSSGVLESMIRGGMVDSDSYIEDVRVSGESATIVVSSDASSGYAESVCYFALESAQAYDNQSGYGDYLGITQVRVKKSWRPWSTASCSL